MTEILLLTKKWGLFWVDSCRRLAMVLRMLDRGKSWKAAAAEAGAPGAAEAPERAFLTSSSVILPPGPLPFKVERTTPFCLARRFAARVALGSRSRAVSSLPSLEYSWAGSGAEEAAGACEPDSGFFSSDLGAAGAASPPASARLKDSKGAMSVPSSTRTAMGYYTDTEL